MQNRKRNTDVQNRILDSVGEVEGGIFWENSIETCILSRMKQITSPGWMYETSVWAWCTGKTQRNRVEREVGGGSGWGIQVNPWLIHVNVWQYPLQYCKVISLQLINGKNKKKNKKQRHYFANKGQCSQGYGFSCGHVWMWELDCEESWAPKNWCFWTVVLEKNLESCLDCKEIRVVHPRDQSRVFIGMTDYEPETPVLLPLHPKSWLIGKDPDTGRDWGQEKKGMTEDQMAGWNHRLDGHEFEWTPEVGDERGVLACCSSWGRNDSDTTEQLNWTDLSFFKTEI